MHWLLERLGVPEWAAEVLEKHAAHYGKTLTDVVREAAVEKAIKLGEENEAKTSQSV